MSGGGENRARPLPADRGLGAEGGFTLVEALVAAILVALATLAVLAAFDTARRATFHAEQDDVATEIAQRELERLRQYPYNQLALTSSPTYSSDTTDPRNRVSGGNFALSRNGSNAAAMVVNGGSLQAGGTVVGGVIAPGPEVFHQGDVTGKLYRFVVWRDDPNCNPQICPGAQDLKRVVVAASIDTSASGGTHNYVEVQSDVVDAKDSTMTSSHPPNLGPTVVAQQFFLSDEPCINSGEPDLSATRSSHAAHNTFGIDCKSTTASRPDAMVTNLPENLDGTLDYATDLEPTPPDADAGLQFQIPPSNGCAFKPTGTNGQLQSHIWVSEKLPSTFQLTGGATLELWVRSINDVVTPGKLCIILFKRAEDPNGVAAPTDTRIADSNNPANLYFTSTQSVWPNGSWQKIRIPMTFASTSAAAGQRIGVSLGLEKSGSPSDQLQFEYDLVNSESRLEVETTTPLD